MDVGFWATSGIWLLTGGTWLPSVLYLHLTVVVTPAGAAPPALELLHTSPPGRQGGVSPPRGHPSPSDTSWWERALNITVLATCMEKEAKTEGQDKF